MLLTIFIKNIHESLSFTMNGPLTHLAKRGARVLISTCVEPIYTRGD